MKTMKTIKLGKKVYSFEHADDSIIFYDGPVKIFSVNLFVDSDIRAALIAFEAGRAYQKKSTGILLFWLLPVFSIIKDPAAAISFIQSDAKMTACAEEIEDLARDYGENAWATEQVVGLQSMIFDVLVENGLAREYSHGDYFSYGSAGDCEIWAGISEALSEALTDEKD